MARQLENSSSVDGCEVEIPDFTASISKNCTYSSFGELQVYSPVEGCEAVCNLTRKVLYFWSKQKYRVKTLFLLFNEGLQLINSQ